MPNSCLNAPSLPLTLCRFLFNHPEYGMKADVKTAVAQLLASKVGRDALLADCGLQYEKLAQDIGLPEGGQITYGMLQKQQEKNKEKQTIQ